MNKDILVYCVNCVHGNSLQKRYENYFGCNTSLCFKCPCGSCSCINPEKGKKFEDRPMFVPKNQNMII